MKASRDWRDRAQLVIPLGAQTFSKSPMSFVQGPSPNFLSKAKGAHVWDADGNRYIDYSMGLGPVIIGHADPVVNEAAYKQVEEGISFSLPHPIEVQVAELLCDLIPCAEMVRFGKNGSDATAAAVRVARAYTRRDKVARCGYHGWQDWYIGSTTRSLGVPEAVCRLTLSFPYDSLDTLHSLFQQHKNEIACVIMEPVTFDPPEPGYLSGVKEICRQHGTLLVFDEIVTGFRFALGGAQAYFAVTPDLACFGKAMSNGFPLSAVVGRAEVMRLFEEVFFSCTHGGEAMSLAACYATIKELQRRCGIDQLWSLGSYLKDGANRLIRQFGMSDYASCVGLPPFTGIRFGGANREIPLLLRSLYQQEAIKRGILTLGNHMVSLAHNQGIIDETLDTYTTVFETIADAVRKGEVAKRLDGPPVQTIIRQA